MFSLLLILCLLARSTASGPVSRAEPAASRDVTAFFQLAQEDRWENVNLTSMSCEDWKNRTWITLQLTYNSLTAFPICLPEALQTLDLSNNLLEEVNGTEIANLPQLRILVLRQNLLQLQFLNLSTTLLGQEGSRGIQESAFAISLSPGDALHRPENTISVLDLSGTFLERIQVEWTRDLPNLRFLHLTKMPKLQSLDTDFRSTPHLRELNCRDSHSLSFVRTEMFESTPNLSHLSFQNCNLSSFNPWNTNSSDSIIINLHGNPLLCDCRLSWLLSTPTIVLQKVLDTFCTTSQENGDRPSVSFSLQDLYNKCQAEKDISLPDSNTPSSQEDAFSLASYYTMTAAMTTDSAPLTKDAYVRLNEEASVMSTTAANSAELMLTKANSSSPEDEAVSESMSHPPFLASLTTSPGFLRELYSQTTDYGSVSQTETLKQFQGELRKTHMAFPQERLFSQPTSEHSTPATGKPDAVPHYIHSFAVERTPQTNLRQPNSTKSSTQSASTPTRPRIHYVDDYEYSEETTEPPVQQTYTSCDYNPCRHLQKPCSELQRASPCLCPGMSTENEIPDPPRLREVSEVTDSSAQIHWCAPNSVVHTYQLMLRDQGDEEGQLVLENIYSTARQYTLYNLSPYTTYHICVTASNSAGLSHTVNQGIAGNSCARFRTKPSYKSVFAALSAASGLFLISTIILSICLCKARKKPRSEQYGTHLVSYKNPAFDYPLKLQTTD
uniref:Leucine rich repeat neuronal 4 n=1 Tax=Meleagris gallopavo TaxID=9103 RepID=A0A803YDS0_MELGA